MRGKIQTKYDQNDFRLSIRYTYVHRHTISGATHRSFVHLKTQKIEDTDHQIEFCELCVSSGCVNRLNEQASNANSLTHSHTKVKRASIWCIGVVPIVPISPIAIHSYLRMHAQAHTFHSKLTHTHTYSRAHTQTGTSTRRMEHKNEWKSKQYIIVYWRILYFSFFNSLKHTATQTDLVVHRRMPMLYTYIDCGYGFRLYTHIGAVVEQGEKRFESN